METLCIVFLSCSVKSESESEVTQSWRLFATPMDCSLPGSSVHGIFPGKNTGVGCHFLLQEIFLIQGLNPGLTVLKNSLFENRKGLMQNGSRIKKMDRISLGHIFSCFIQTLWKRWQFQSLDFRTHWREVVVVFHQRQLIKYNLRF